MLSPPSASFRAHYQSLVASGAIEADAAQAEAAGAFADFEQRLASYTPLSKQGLLGRLFADKDEAPPRGLYIHGEVGRGKTMLMDLFFQHSPVEHKRRAHFHEFMADVHERIYGFRAMILGRLFSKLFELGTVVVATSNVAPDDLYKGGLNRALFLPFIAQIVDHMDVLRLDARTDFRLEKLTGVKMWLVPADRAADAALDRAWVKMTGNAKCKPRDISIKGRTLHVPCSADGVARFSFADICEKPLAASDYLRLAHDYHTIMIDRIPVMDYPDRNAARRFIALIDTLYRLIEMSSESYLALPHGHKDSVASGSSTGLVET